MYKRGEPWPLEVFPYEQILSFGAPLPNAYKIAVEGRELVFETQMVGPDGFGLFCTLSHQNCSRLFLPSAGHGHRQAHEGLHQHDCQKALQQLSVCQQPRQPVQRLVSPAPNLDLRRGLLLAMRPTSELWKEQHVISS